MLVKNSGNYNSGFVFSPKNKFHIDKLGMIISLTIFIYACSENDSSIKDNTNSLTAISSGSIITPKSIKNVNITNNSKIFSTKNQPNKMPNWLIKYVDKLNKMPVKDSPEAITEYEYKGKSVYYFSPSCCGKDGKLFDQNNNLICTIARKKSKTGNSCPDFDIVKKYKKIVWQENRD